MKVAILAGGRGSRLGGEQGARPKPLAPIGGRPILWHVMRYYAHFGHTDFVIALGHAGDRIRDFFRAEADRSDHLSLWEEDSVETPAPVEPAHWRVRLVDTGEETGTGGRVLRLRPFLSDGAFMLTWADGLANVDLDRLLAFHREHGRLATVTAVHPPSRFGRLELEGEVVLRFDEKGVNPEEWVNGAFFVLEPGVFDCIDGDATTFEREPMTRLAERRALMAYRHEGFWQCMDVPAEHAALDALWRRDQAPWKVWA